MVVQSRQRRTTATSAASPSTCVVRNDWMATDESKVVKVADKLFTAKATLKKEWAYKFKFADSGWSCGTNFGYKSLSDGAAARREPVPVNLCSA